MGDLEGIAKSYGGVSLRALGDLRRSVRDRMVGEMLGELEERLFDETFDVIEWMESRGDGAAVLFLSEVGESGQALVEGLRSWAAAELLRDTDLPIYRISQAVGFQKPKRLARVFKRLVGCAPREYRSDERSGQANRRRVRRRFQSAGRARELLGELAGDDRDYERAIRVCAYVIRTAKARMARREGWHEARLRELEEPEVNSGQARLEE